MDREQLNGHSIFALREFARRTGVSSPTSKSKETLIQEILDISEGRKAPKISKTRQGRPPKNYGYPIVDMFINGKAQTVSQTILEQHKVPYVYETESHSVTGYAEVINPLQTLLWELTGGGLVCYYIPNSMSAEYSIKSGDLISAELGIGEKSNQVKEIYCINNIPLKKHSKERLDYYKIPAVRANKNVQFQNPTYANFNIKYGEAAFIYGVNNAEVSTSVINLINDCLADAKLYINVSIVEKNKYLLEDVSGTENFTVNMVEDAQVAKKVITLATERMKRLLEKGNNVVVAIDDVKTLLSVEDCLSITKVLMSLAKTCEKGSVTLIAAVGESGSIFEKLADCRIKAAEELVLM